VRGFLLQKIHCRDDSEDEIMSSGFIPFHRGSDAPGVTLRQRVAGSSAHVADGFKPSSYDADLTMDGTAQAVAIASGAGRVRIYNQGATTESIRFAFGASAADAQANLTIVTAAATTGILIPAQADNASQCLQVLGIPEEATHYAVANTVAADVQVVNIIQGA